MEVSGKGVLAGLGLGVIGSGCGSTAEPKSASGQPNILLIFPDELRPHALGCYGNSQCKTPVIDDLASKGVIFDSTCAPYPVCSPTRASLMTGLYPHANGELENGVLLGNKFPCMAESLRTAGYETAYVGKWHLGGDKRGIIPRELRHGFEDFWVFTDGGFESGKWRAAEDDKPLQPKEWRPEYECNRVERFIRRRHQKPWFLMYSPLQPHTPYEMPSRWSSLYDPGAMTLRPNVEDEKNRKEYALYYGFVSWTDLLIGRLIQALKETNQFDNTLIVLTSDHGWNMGSHNKSGKRSVYEESCRIPLIFSGGVVDATRRGLRYDVPTTTCDMFPTFAELGQAKTPDGLHGDSLLGHFRGGRLLERESVYVEVLWTPKPKPHFDPPRRAVRTRRYKYVEEDGKPLLLFDLETDPYEMKNRLDDPELKDVLTGLQGQFKYWRERTADTWPKDPWELWNPTGWEADEG